MNSKIRKTTFNFGRSSHEAIFLSWKDVEKILGCEHSGRPVEDEQLVTWLLTRGAPEWVKDASGSYEEEGWYLVGPEIEEEDDGS